MFASASISVNRSLSILSGFPAASAIIVRSVSYRAEATALIRYHHSRQFAEMFSGGVAREQIHVRVDHDANQLVEAHFWFPTENLLRF
jgi:hypothetical protein